MMPTDETKVSLIGKDISYIQKDIADIKLSLKELAGVYVTREALAEVAKQTEERLVDLEGNIKDIKTDIHDLKNPNFITKNLPTGIITIVAVVLEFLLISYLQNLHCLAQCVK